MFALIVQGAIDRYPYTVTDFRRDNPSVSLPRMPSDENLVAFGMFRVFSSTPPSFDEASEVLTEELPVFNSDSARWEQVWSVRSMTSEEVQAAADGKAGQVRSQRNELLASSDWTQVLDAPVDQGAWAAYRQELRDITTQEEFPWDVVWPNEP